MCDVETYEQKKRRQDRFIMSGFPFSKFMGWSIGGKYGKWFHWNGAPWSVYDPSSLDVISRIGGGVRSDGVKNRGVRSDGVALAISVNSDDAPDANMVFKEFAERKGVFAATCGDKFLIYSKLSNDEIDELKKRLYVEGITEPDVSEYKLADCESKRQEMESRLAKVGTKYKKPNKEESQKITQELNRQWKEMIDGTRKAPSGSMASFYRKVELEVLGPQRIAELYPNYKIDESGNKRFVGENHFVPASSSPVATDSSSQKRNVPNVPKIDFKAVPNRVGKVEISQLMSSTRERDMLRRVWSGGAHDRRVPSSRRRYSAFKKNRQRWERVKQLSPRWRTSRYLCFHNKIRTDSVRIQHI
jgi:hypothetical protein